MIAFVISGKRIFAGGSRGFVRERELTAGGERIATRKRETTQKMFRIPFCVFSRLFVAVPSSQNIFAKPQIINTARPISGYILPRSV
jgi:hypothetical protein